VTNLIKRYSLTTCGLLLILLGAWVYFRNSSLGASIWLAIGVAVLFYDRDRTAIEVKDKFKEVLGWIGLLIAAVIIALLIKKDITQGGFFRKEIQPSIYTLNNHELA
jgi:hypothetical protein